jgi:diguanylate cyclase (GGDEF)-like protein/PAS domain S-box-containing protein
MAVTSLEKGWLRVNDKLCEIFGYPREELIKLTWADLTHPEDIDADVAQFERVLSGEIDGYSMDKRFIRKNGDVIYACISANCILGDNGNIDHFVAFVQDITDRKNDELKLKQLNENLEKLIKVRTKELEETNKKLKIESETDFLTQLANRRVYERRLKENIATARREKSDLSLLLIDADYFKAYNDKYGHDQGDKALINIAKSIENSLHRSTDLVARFGGEEFIVLLPSTNSEGALEIAERIRADIEALNIEHIESGSGSGSGVVTVSIGVESMKAGKLSKDELFKHSDDALYIAKNKHNCCHLFSLKD